GSPQGVERILRGRGGRFRTPRAVRARVRAERTDGWTAEYAVSLSAIGIGRGDARPLALRFELSAGRTVGPKDLRLPAEAGRYAKLVSPDGWGAEETWPPITPAISREFDDHEALARLTVEHEAVAGQTASERLIITGATRPRDMQRIRALINFFDEAKSRNPALPSLDYFRGRLLVQANMVDEARALVESIPAPLLALDANAFLAAEFYRNVEEFEKARALTKRFPYALGMEEVVKDLDYLDKLRAAEKEAAAAATAEGREPLPMVRLVTSKGTIEVELFEDTARGMVCNLMDLVLRRRYYDGLRFNPVVGNQAARVGDPRSREMRETGADGPAWRVRPDGKGRPPLRGRLVPIPVSEQANHGSQFAITLAPVVASAKRLPAFGRVTKGMDVVLRLAQNDRLERVEIIRKRNHRYDANAYRLQ
ncbi:MAG: peptidylprolyl isomerase, partial [Planctomycetota bacterium]